MGSKLILLLWLVVGSLLTFFCLNKDKRELLLNYTNSYFETGKVSDKIKVENIIKEDDVPKETKAVYTSIEDENNSSDDSITLQNRNDTEQEKSELENKKLKSIEEKITTILNDNPIYFKINSSMIKQDSQEGLDRVFVALKTLKPGTVVTVEGHTDAMGDASSNKKLSQKRADAVKFYLKKSGLNNLIIKAKGYGEEKPLVSNPNDEKNRRVEISLKRGVSDGE